MSDQEAFEGFYKEVWLACAEVKDKEIKSLMQAFEDRNRVIAMQLEDKSKLEIMLKDMIELNESNCSLARQKEASFYEHCNYYDGIEDKLALAVKVLQGCEHLGYVEVSEALEKIGKNYKRSAEQDDARL